MSELKAFIGHSFTDDDKDVIRQFLDFFNHVKDMAIGFFWEHAEPAEPKILSEKVLKLMEGKNLFIAICTAKELVITSDKLKKSWRNTLKAKDNEFVRKTSDWIIQEIGVAKGKNMDVIILLEEGLRRPGGLQGDLEYISFNRNEPSKSFNKILEMLKVLTPKKTMGHIAQKEVAEKKKSEIAKGKSDESLEPSNEWKRKDYEYGLFRSIARSDKEQEEKIITAYLKSEEGQEDTNIESFKALKFYFRQVLGQGASVEELQLLSNEYPDNSDVAFYLGKAYEEYKDFNKAAEQYEKSAKLAKNDKERLSRICNAAVAKCKKGYKASDVWLLNQTRNCVDGVEDGEFNIILALKTISEILKNDDKYLAYTERLLAIQPDDHNLRFELAYKYSNSKISELALFHYLLIPDKDRSSTTWNNIGVANAELKIEGKAVEAYRESERLYGTLAMSNLAHKFIREGFLKEAEEICDRALKIENYDKHVGTVISRIHETIEKEDHEQKTLLDDTEQMRIFYVDFGQACIKKPLDSYEGVWIGPECELKIRIIGRSLIAAGNYEKKQLLTSGLGALYAGAPRTQAEKRVKVKVRYQGVITGYGIEFKLYLEEEGEQPSLPTALPYSGPSKEGLMIMADDMQKIRVYEKGTKATEKFYELSKE